MKDPRVAKLADVLVNYSTKVTKDDIVCISVYGTAAVPLLRETYNLCIQNGAKYVDYSIRLPEIQKDFLNTASKEQVKFFPEHIFEFTKKATVFIGISAAENSMVNASTSQENMILQQKVLEPIQKERVDNSRWVITRFPTQGQAQDAKMSLDEYEDFLFDCSTIDWAEESKKQDKLVEILNDTKTVRIKGKDTDLTFSKEGMAAVKCDGKCNIPDGEVFTCPTIDSAEGYITYNCPSLYNGKEFQNVRFRFERGKIVEASSQINNTYLDKILDTDEGARRLGEFAFGVNPMIDSPIRNTLFDEKIWGSIHLTPGNAYKECDNNNKSAVHWDLVRIMREDGEVYLDGNLVQKNGLFVTPELMPLNPKK